MENGSGECSDELRPDNPRVQEGQVHERDDDSGVPLGGAGDIHSGELHHPYVPSGEGRRDHLRRLPAVHTGTRRRPVVAGEDLRRGGLQAAGDRGRRVRAPARAGAEARHLGDGLLPGQGHQDRRRFGGHQLAEPRGAQVHTVWRAPRRRGRSCRSTGWRK